MWATRTRPTCPASAFGAERSKRHARASAVCWPHRYWLPLASQSTSDAGVPRWDSPAGDHWGFPTGPSGRADQPEPGSVSAGNLQSFPSPLPRINPGRPVACGKSALSRRPACLGGLVAGHLNNLPRQRRYTISWDWPVPCRPAASYRRRFRWALVRAREAARIGEN